ncbi:outer membrane beta-barrel protein [Flavihumibacter rivuli]|uniref:outer membrane beta-barrel protein n=1 Tax=Flavihumibacter rivuli TaxID=2838156 RepID=UPI001BDDD3F3|nr:outer membrane beta-barrel protein [Flavihumibacter rivuli]ULQ55994.1 outer membrane beta-barrel protein [Flavihumibacter rivuli]
MRKLVVALAALFVVAGAQAQTEPTDKKKKKDWSKVNLGNRANDHFMFQFGYDGWAQKPDSIRTTGIGRHLNIYFMFDFPVKVDPRFSIGIGAGIGSSNIFLDKQEADITGRTNDLRFPDVSDTTHFKKYKLANAWAELPIELRFVANPMNSNKSWKIAIGVKVGTMLDAHTKGKTLQNSKGSTISNHIEKEKSKTYFNNTRFSGTVRFGYGNFTLHGAYQINSLIKDNRGPQVRPFSIGLTISGL